MKVLVALPDSDTRISLEGLNGYKNEKCEPKIEDNLAVFELSLINFYDCGIIRVVNKLTVSGGVRLIGFRLSYVRAKAQSRADSLIDFPPQCAYSFTTLCAVGEENVLS